MIILSVVVRIVGSVFGIIVLSLEILLNVFESVMEKVWVWGFESVWGLGLSFWS